MNKLTLKLLCLVLVCSLSMTACGLTAENGDKILDNVGLVATSDKVNDTENENIEITKAQTVKIEDEHFSELNEITDAIKNDSDSLVETIIAKKTEIDNTIGDDVDKYQSNRDLVANYYDYIISETDKFFEQTQNRSKEYFKLSFDMNSNDSKQLDRSFDDIYDTVYSGVYDDIYDEIYSGILDDIYDDYYSGLLDDAYDSMEYSEWSALLSDFYKNWNKTLSDFYKNWSGATGDFYTLWSTMNGAVYNSSLTYDDSLCKAEEKIAERKAEALKAAENNAEKEERRKDRKKFNLEYEIIDGKAYVSGYSGSGNYIEVPSSYENYDVVGFVDSAFEGCKDLITVSFWADITEIGDSVFKDCSNLAEISIPSSVQVIRNHAFENCSNLKDLTIWGDPDIGEYAFANCSSLEKISIGNDTKIIADHAFDGCIALETVTLWGTPDIGQYAFAKCSSIKKLSFGSSSKMIGDHAFDGCTALETVTMWGKDTKIGKDAFANCPALNKVPKETGEIGLSVKLDASSGTDSSILKEENNNENKSNSSSEEIRAEFQAAMDEYLEFFEEYCDFMKSVKESGDMLSVVDEYTSYMTQYSETMTAFDELEDDDMSDAEMELYLDTMNAIQKMLIGAL